MESYDDFIQTQLSRLDGKGNEQKLQSPCRGSSVIRFYGSPILPPLLTVEQREEMLKYRADAQGLVDRRNETTLERRMVHLRELFDSVQVRRVPTLREFMGDEPLARGWEGGHGGGASEGAGPEGSERDDPPPLSCPPSAPHEELHPQLGARPSPPLTSTARDLPEFPSLEAEPEVIAWDARGGEGGVLQTAPEFRLGAESHGDVSHQSASSGYHTHDNTELAEGQAGVAEGHAGVAEGHAGVAEGHAEVAEGHAEVVAVQAKVAAGDMVVAAGHRLDAGEGERKSERAGERKEEEEGERKGEIEGERKEEGAGQTDAAPESFFLHGTLGSSQKVQDVPGGPQPDGGVGGCAGGGEAQEDRPCRLSLQTLLKRSQEHRRRQRLLRSARADKENQPGAAQLLRPRDRRPGPGPGRVQFCPTGPASPRTAAGRGEGAAGPERQESGEEERGAGGRRRCQEEGPDCASPRVVPSPDGFQGRDSPAPLKPAGPPVVPARTESPPPAHKAPPPIRKVPPPVRKAPPPRLLSDRFGTAPSPRFCTSPVRCNREARSGQKLPVSTPVSASSGHRGRQSSADEGGAGGARAGRGAELAQLETNLSSLKALIWDLQATLTDTPTDTPSEEPRVPSQDAVRPAEAQPRPVPSLAQRRRVPDLFRKVPVLSDSSNQAPPCCLPLKQPSAMETALGGGSGGHCQDPRAKCRLHMNTTAWPGHGPLLGTTKGWVSVLEEQQLQLKQTHAGQLQALLQEQQLQLQELLQSLSLQGVSVCGSGVKGVEPPLLEESSGPRPLPQLPSSALPPAWRPLVAAAVKGYLTRRLLRTERLAQLQRTAKDSQQLLWTLQSHTPPARGDRLLQERVLLQLRSAQYEIHDILFGFSAAERMQIISWDRQLLRARQLKRKESGETRIRGRGSLSAATMKALERKRSAGLQKRAAGRQRGPVGGVCGEQVRRLSHRELRPALSSGKP